MAASNDFDNKLDKALQYLADRGFSRELRDEQKSSLRQLYRGGDLLAVLPTGFGKSLIFQLLALMKKECVIVVVCPLKVYAKIKLRKLCPWELQPLLWQNRLRMLLMQGSSLSSTYYLKGFQSIKGFEIFKKINFYPHKFQSC